MECKFIYHIFKLICIYELIDTLWNVNTQSLIACLTFHTELIDTLWNVNTVCLDELTEEQIRINRYIMECKCYILLS